jgi:hypothetical protein
VSDLSEIDEEIIEKYEASLLEHEVPPIEIFREIVNTAMNRHVKDADFWNMGKHMQANGLDVEPSCEHEVVAGYWQWLKLKMPNATSLFENFKSLKPS